jgi:hypothetical protein
MAKEVSFYELTSINLGHTAYANILLLNRSSINAYSE